MTEKYVKMKEHGQNLQDQIHAEKIANFLPEKAFTVLLTELTKISQIEWRGFGEHIRNVSQGPRRKRKTVKNSTITAMKKIY